MLLLILESLGSTELLFILVMALIFLGPRKLPQLSRSLGKSLAEFRKASEDFKRTWEREVALESALTEDAHAQEMPAEENSIWTGDRRTGSVATSETVVPAQRTFARETTSFAPDGTVCESGQSEPPERVGPSESSRKRDWL